MLDNLFYGSNLPFMSLHTGSPPKYLSQINGLNMTLLARLMPNAELKVVQAK
jgi:hypothetical protein